MSRLRAETVSQILVISNSSARSCLAALARWTFRGRGVLFAAALHSWRETASTRSECGAMIEQRNVGKSSLRVSAIGLGCNNFGRSLDLAASRPVIHKALDLGITFFDCADVYGRRGGAETILAQVLGSRRKDIVLTTKFGRRMDDAGRLMGGSRHYIFTAVEASLRRLKKSAGRLRHRGRHQARAGGGKRPRRRLGADPGGHGGGRQALRRAGLTIPGTRRSAVGWARARSAMPTLGGELGTAVRPHGPAAHRPAKIPTVTLAVGSAS
jgi:Aldo/keto reductase family